MSVQSSGPAGSVAPLYCCTDLHGPVSTAGSKTRRSAVSHGVPTCDFAGERFQTINWLPPSLQVLATCPAIGYPIAPSPTHPTTGGAPGALCPPMVLSRSIAFNPVHETAVLLLFGTFFRGSSIEAAGLGSCCQCEQDGHCYTAITATHVARW